MSYRDAIRVDVGLVVFVGGGGNELSRRLIRVHSLVVFVGGGRPVLTPFRMGVGSIQQRVPSTLMIQLSQLSPYSLLVPFDILSSHPFVVNWVLFQRVQDATPPTTSPLDSALDHGHQLCLLGLRYATVFPNWANSRVFLATTDL
jgi:hypothetical protein